MKPAETFKAAERGAARVGACREPLPGEGGHARLSLPHERRTPGGHRRHHLAKRNAYINTSAGETYRPFIRRDEPLPAEETYTTPIGAVKL